MTLKQQLDALRQKRAGVVEQMQTLSKQGESNDDGVMSDEQQTQFDALNDQLDEIDAQIKATQAKIDENDERLAKLAKATKTTVATPLTRMQLTSTPTPMPQAQQMPRIVAPRVGRLRAFRGQNAELDAYAAGQWIRKNLFGRADAAEWLRNNAPTADLNEGTPGDGGYLTPDLIASTILDVMEDYGVAMQVCQVIPMTSDSLDVAKRSSGPTVYYPGEASAITESSSTLSQVALTAVKRAILTYISRELLDDAVVNMADFAMREMGRELALQMDNEFINGDGTATYGSETGLDAALGDGGSIAAAAAWSSFTMTHFSSCIAALADKYHPNASWIMSRAFHAATVERLLNALGGTTAAEVVNGVGKRSFMGYPINFSDKAPTSDANSTDACFFGDFEASCVLGMRKQVSLAQSEHYRFAYDQLAIRATVRYDINVHRGGSHAAADGYVGLRETS